MLIDGSRVSVEETAALIGDDPDRLRRVLRAQEPLGLTAWLAMLAVKNGLPPVDRDDKS